MTPRELLDHEVLSQRYFFPRADAPRDAEVWQVEVPGASLVGAHVGHAGHPALLFFHGNGETVADWIGPLSATGMEAFLAEYRGYGASTGTPALATMLDDALAVAHATNRPPGDLVVYGRSVGSLYALHVAAHLDVRAVVLESGIADLSERLDARVKPEEVGVTLQELHAAVNALFDQRAKIQRAKCPVLVVHTENDSMVRVHHARKFAEWAGDRAELVVFPMGDHNTIHAFNRPQIWDCVRNVAGRARRAPS
jgi:pimeloyl-ACP methyl ester carboxylesterase